MRNQCLDLVMTQERGMAPVNRYGLAAGMTPLQRWSLEKRDARLSECCGTPIDAEDLRTGQYLCQACGVLRVVAPIPDSGDAWNRRHTTLARRTIAFLCTGVAPGARLPAATRLADEWGVRQADLQRVYHELAGDNLIELQGKTWVRLPGGTRAAEWLPLHER